jgi:hypothetical protein
LSRDFVFHIFLSNSSNLASEEEKGRNYTCNEDIYKRIQKKFKKMNSLKSGVELIQRGGGQRRICIEEWEKRYSEKK